MFLAFLTHHQLTHGSSMECRRSSSQKHCSFPFYLASTCTPYLYPGIQPQLVFFCPDKWILCDLMALSLASLWKSIHFWDFQLPSPLWDSKGTSDPRTKKVLEWVVFSDLLPFNDSNAPVAVSSPDFVLRCFDLCFLLLHLFIASCATLLISLFA